MLEVQVTWILEQEHHSHYCLLDISNSTLYYCCLQHTDRSHHCQNKQDHLIHSQLEKIHWTLPSGSKHQWVIQSFITINQFHLLGWLVLIGSYWHNPKEDHDSWIWIGPMQIKSMDHVPGVEIIIYKSHCCIPIWNLRLPPWNSNKCVWDVVLFLNIVIVHPP